MGTRSEQFKHFTHFFGFGSSLAEGWRWRRKRERASGPTTRRTSGRWNEAEQYGEGHWRGKSGEDMVKEKRARKHSSHT